MKHRDHFIVDSQNKATQVFPVYIKLDIHTQRHSIRQRRPAQKFASRVTALDETRVRGRDGAERPGVLRGCTRA